MKFSTIAPLGLLIGAGIWAARRPEKVKEGLSDALEYFEDTTQPLAKRFEREVLPQARKAIKNSSRAATPLLNAASPMMPLSMPMEVMPTCTDDKN